MEPSVIGEKRSKRVSNRSNGRSKNTIKCIVNRVNCDPSMTNQPIYVCHNDVSGRKNFNPGEIVELTPGQIGVLKNCKEETELPIGMDSMIYSAQNPMQAAKNQYPNMQIKRDATTGIISAYKSVPLYIVQENATQ